MPEQPYNTREIQELFRSVHEKIDHNRRDAKEQLDRIELNGEETRDQVVFTNGRVRALEQWRMFILGALAILGWLISPDLVSRFFGT